MMPKKVHLSSIEDKDPEKCIAATGSGPKLKTTPSQRSSDTTSSSPESSGTNGDVKRNGKSRRRKKRSSNPDSGTEEVVRGQSVEPGTGHKGDPAASLAGLQSECASVWMERSSYERAESLYHSWLACNSNGTGTKSRPPPAQGKTTPPTVTQSCQHGEHVACHHLVNDVWVNKRNFDQAEDHFLKSVQPSVPNSLNLQRPPVTPDSPDEGYQSQTPTPATPLVQQQPALTAAARPSVNGLPGFPLEILQDVWLDKPRYDRAEAAFYQNLYGSNSSKRPGATSNSRSGDRPQRLLEEEEEEEEEAMSVEEKPATPQGKAEIFHALHPIQEEEEPAEVSDKEDPSGPGTAYFLHPDSERVWMDRRQFDVAESRFHDRGGKAAGKKGRRSAGVAATQIGVKSTMTSVQFLAQEKIWFEKPKYDEAERRFYENQNRSSQLKQDVGPNSSILQDIARARENIQKSLAGNTNTTCSAADQELVTRIKNLELENHNLYKVMGDLRSSLSKLESRVAVLEKSPAAASSTVALTNGTSVQQKTTTPAKPVAADDDDDDDDMDLFGSDEEDDEEAEKLREQRVKEYAAKKSKKPAIIAKSSILLDVKPWDDETDMKQLETNVRSVQMDGLLWGSSKLVPVGYGIQKLQINCVVEDDKVGTDILEEEIVKFEDYVQSVDVAAFNKI